VTIVQRYIRLFEDLDDQGWLQRTRELAERVIDFTSFMERVVLASEVRLPVREPRRIVGM